MGNNIKQEFKRRTYTMKTLGLTILAVGTSAIKLENCPVVEEFCEEGRDTATSMIAAVEAFENVDWECDGDDCWFNDSEDDNDENDEGSDGDDGNYNNDGNDGTDDYCDDCEDPDSYDSNGDGVWNDEAWYETAFWSFGWTGEDGWYIKRS